MAEMYSYLRLIDQTRQPRLRYGGYVEAVDLAGYMFKTYDGGEALKHAKKQRKASYCWAGLIIAVTILEIIMNGALLTMHILNFCGYLVVITESSATAAARTIDSSGSYFLSYSAPHTGLLILMASIAVYQCVVSCKMKSIDTWGMRKRYNFNVIVLVIVGTCFNIITWAVNGMQLWLLWGVQSFYLLIPAAVSFLFTLLFIIKTYFQITTASVCPCHRLYYNEKSDGCVCCHCCC